MKLVDFDISKYQARREESARRREISFAFGEPDCVVTHASVFGPYFCWNTTRILTCTFWFRPGAYNGDTRTFLTTALTLVCPWT